MSNYKKTEDMANEFHTITEEMCETFTRKNRDYGNSFFQSLDNKGIIAAVVRMEDKMNRLDTLCMSEGKVKDESKRDTLLDLANYAIMTVLWLDKKDKSCDSLQEANAFCEETLRRLKMNIDNGKMEVDAFEVKNTLDKILRYIKSITNKIN